MAKVKTKNPTIYHVKVSVKPHDKGYKSMIFQGLVYADKSEDATKMAIEKISTGLKEQNVESDYKILSSVKLRTDFIFYDNN